MCYNVVKPTKKQGMGMVLQQLNNPNDDDDDEDDVTKGLNQLFTFYCY